MARCVDMNKLKMFGMKSHDCHVFMQRLIPIAFHDLLPNNVWQALTELSMFYKDLTSRVITTADMVRLEKIIPLTLCKLKRIFSPSFFDSMEHLPIHLAYEARLAGPVQYRWMYPFERFLRRLKNNVRNKAKVEGSICNAYLIEEASSFCAYYFADSVKTRHCKCPRNSDDARPIVSNMFSIFKFFGRPIGAYVSIWLDDKEYHAARTYILLNYDEVKPFINMYEQELQQQNPAILPDEVDKNLETHFASWFERHVKEPRSNVQDQMMKDLASGPLRNTRVYSGYYVNGFKFHVSRRDSTTLTNNSGVCVKGSSNISAELDYYGRLDEIIEVEYPALPIKRIVLFKCSWYDPTPRIGTRVHSIYKLVEVNANRRFNKFEPFIFAVQAGQVFYVKYPTIRRGPSEWLAVCRMKARSTIEIPTSLALEYHDAFQNDEVGGHSVDSQVQTTSQLLVDVNVTYEELDDQEMSTDDEIVVAIESDHDNLETIDDYDADCDDY
ncbi:uncharacterized protein [Henckelia pumila]|uniref:uncharacterized protein n=1 Tax=Henckelia pumila TaxID=405737 RepID=UPI003C6E4A9D